MLCHVPPPDVKQWRGLAFCLSQLRLTEKCCRKLVDDARLYRHALADETVTASMMGIVSKVSLLLLVLLVRSPPCPSLTHSLLHCRLRSLPSQR